MAGTAFDAVYEENAQIVYKTALYYSGNCDTAEEITQAVFMKLYVSMENINMEAVDNWLIVTAKHMAINIGRKGRREVLRENVTETGETDPASVSPEEEFISRLRKREYRELAETIFTEFVPGERAVVRRDPAHLFPGKASERGCGCYGDFSGEPAQYVVSCQAMDKKTLRRTVSTLE